MSKAAHIIDAPTVETFTITGERIVQLMGMSFLVGSLFTILMLVILDLMRVQREKRK